MDIIEKIAFNGIDKNQKKRIMQILKDGTNNYCTHRDFIETRLSVLIKKNNHKEAIAYFKEEIKKSGLKLLDELYFKNLEMIEYYPHLYIDNKNDYKKAMSIFLELLNKYTILEYNIKIQVFFAHMLDPYGVKHNVEAYLHEDKKEILLSLKNMDKLLKLFDDITKNDTEVNRETLENDEVIQALNNSISKFIELYYRQPQELKHILIDYKETPIKDYIEVTENAINNSDDIKLLDKIFQTYKRDEQHRIYNYDLFAFLYYAYGIEISFEDLFNSPLLNNLGVYTFKSDRDKPILKKNKVAIMQQHKKNVELTQYKENIYLHNLIEFIQTVNTKHKNMYLLSYLVDISHNLKASKEFMQNLTYQKTFKNVTYENLPQPINTLLLPYTQIAN